MNNNNFIKQFIDPNNGLPEEYLCPILKVLMIGDNTPMVDSTTGITYGKKAIETWINKKGTSPTSRKKLQISDLLPNITLKNMIIDWNFKNMKKNIKNFNKNDLVVSVVNDNKNKNILVNLRCKETDERNPIHPVLVLDTSGSTHNFAELKGVENSGITILDLICHTAKTFAKTLQTTDYLTVIEFNTYSRVIFKKLSMDEDGKILACNEIDKLYSQGCTNLFKGVKNALDILNKESEIGYNEGIFLLTDGLPYSGGEYDPDNTVSDNDLYGFRNLDQNRDKFPIFTYGFGNNIDSKLLQTIAKKSNAHSFYISDVSMIATIFKNTLSLFLTTAIKNIQLSVFSKNNVEKDNIILESWNADNNQVQCKIPSLSYGQEFNLVIPLKNSVKNINLQVNFTTFKNEVINVKDFINTGSIYQIGYSTDIKENTVRLLFVNTLKRAIKYMELRQDIKAENLIRNLCENWETYGGKIIGNGNSKSSDEIYKDLSGQVFEAFNLTQQGKNEDWFNNWGKNYLPSLINSHLYMIYSNFKDPGLGVYNTGKLFSKIIDFADTIFNKIKLSEPSRKNEINNSYSNSNRSPPPSPVIGIFNSSNTSCYDGNCYTEVLINNKFNKKFIKDIVKGDIIKTGKGSAKILAILKSPINSKVEMISFPDKLLITEWHPIKINGEWKFPCETKTGIKVTVSSKDIYSFVLDKDHTMYVNNIETVTLGHNLKGLPQHPYFGTEKIINDIMQNIDKDGIAYSSGTIKENNLVIGLKFIKDKYRVRDNNDPSCYDGKCLARMGDDTLKELKYIKKGDKVYTSSGIATVKGILKSDQYKNIKFCKFPNGLLITSWHPILRNGKFVFPFYCHDKEIVEVYSSYVYSFLLDRGHTILISGTVLGSKHIHMKGHTCSECIETVTLGHNLKGLAAHEYFGSSRVIKDINNNMNSDGIATCVGQIYNNKGEVSGLYFDKEIKYTKEKIEKDAKEKKEKEEKEKGFTKWKKWKPRPFVQRPRIQFRKKK